VSLTFHSYVPLESWPEIYNESKFPYPYELKNCVFKAVAGEYTLNSVGKKKTISIDFDAFNYKFQANMAWVKRWGKLRNLSVSLIEITKEMYEKYENN
jgi:hypothetical protein